MAVTVAPTILDRVKFIGRKKAVLASLDLTGTYVTASGFALTPAMFGLSTLDNIIFLDKSSNGGHVPQYTRSTKIVKLRWSAAGASAVLAAVTNGTDLAGADIRVIALGV